MIAACGKGEARRGAQAAGEEEPKYERVISTAPSNTEIIAALGLAKKLVAVDRYSADVAGIRPNVTVIDFLNPDIETMLALEPDIIISNSINHQHSGSEPLIAAANFGIQVVYIPVSNSLESIISDVLYIADLLGVSERGKTIAVSMRRDIEIIKKTGDTITEKRTVYFEVEPAPHAVSFGGGVFLDEMIHVVGAKNIFAKQEGFFVVNSEEVIALNPDVILTNAAGGGEDPIKELYSRPGFSSIKAIQQKRVHFINTNASGRASPNIVKALKLIALAVYPEYYE
jgi:iron complex transport system substrate-binding protein